MKPPLFATCVVALVMTLAGVANATDRERFEKGVAKYALRFDQVFAEQPLKPRALCVCTPVLQPGFLYVDPDAEQIVCLLPTFGTDGSLETAAPCLTYEVLSR